MAHEIDQTKGFAAFASRKEIPWHGLGKVFDRDLTVEEALKDGGLEFEVLKQPNIHQIPGQESLISPDSFFLYRDDSLDVLAPHVGKLYEPLQNRDVFAIVDDMIAQDPSLKIETVGALKGGQRTFVTLKNGTMNIGRGDEIETYLLIYNSFDGLTSIQARFTPIRVVCNNTLQLAKSRGKSIRSIRHYSNSEARLREALESVEMLKRGTKNFVDMAKAMTKTKYSVEDFYSYLSGVFMTDAERKKVAEQGREGISTRKANMLKEVIQYAESGPGQDKFGGTAWWAYNAVTGYFSNARQYKSEDVRMQSLTDNYGNAGNHLSEALVLATGEKELPSIKMTTILN